MFTASITLASGEKEQRTVYNIDDVILPNLDTELRGRGWKKTNADYLNAYCCLDTETSKLTHYGKDSEIVVDGVWIYQWALGINDVLIAGRTADELLTLLKKIFIYYELSNKRKLSIFVHNLAYDASYLMVGLYKYFDGKIEVFSTGQRRPVKITIDNALELKCSYKLVNKSLDAWCADAAPIKHKKLVGAIDYDLLRTPQAELTANDWDYMLNDVCCQQDCLRVRMDGEHFRTLPLTSTGFVRRDMRYASFADKSWKRKFHSTLPTAKQYLLMRQCFTGGYTHANSLAMGIWHDVQGYDAVSMYPAVLATEEFPCGSWIWHKGINETKLKELIKTPHLATIALVSFKNIRLKDFATWNPYLSHSKCLRKPVSKNKQTLDNGKIIYCSQITIALCEIDLQIVLEQYDYDKMEVHNAMYCDTAPLPNWFKNQLRNWYTEKVKLKLAPPNETEEEKITRLRRYAQVKQLINACFGMCATAICHPIYRFNFLTQEWEKPIDNNNIKGVREQLEKMKKPTSRAFLRYDWGLYTTAHARKRLFRAMSCCGLPLYSDTDSVKGCDWDLSALEKFNKELKAKSDNAGFTITDLNGKENPIGVFEHDGEYTRFSAVHAKCYAYETELTDYEKSHLEEMHKRGRVITKENTMLHCTIAGVTASNGAPIGSSKLITKEMELERLENLVDGKVFTACGGTRSVYIDGEHDVTVNGEKIHSYGGCAILDTTYEIGGINDLIAMYALSDSELPYK